MKQYRCRRRRWPWQKDHVKAYCPGCGVDLMCNPETTSSDWVPKRFRAVVDPESFVCPCLMESAWDFGPPAPVLLEGRVLTWRVRVWTQQEGG